MSAYASFANQGLRMKPYLIERITDREGNIVEQAAPHASDALRADTAFILTSLLRGVVERGTAARAHKLGRPIAGKTGTTNDFTDAWFIGFEPSLAAGVWVGFDEKKGDKLGPISIAAAASAPVASAAPADKPAAGEAKPESRVVVFGDSDFASNLALGVSGNKDLFMNAVSWMAQQENLIAIRPREADDRRITMTAGQQLQVIILALVLVPLFVLGSGVYAWWRRR